MVAALAVGHHLGLMFRAYWLDLLDPDGPPSGRWRYSARTRQRGPSPRALRWWVAAGPRARPAERVGRGRAAVMALWSDPRQWEPIAGAAGWRWTGNSPPTEPLARRSCGSTRRRGAVAEPADQVGPRSKDTVDGRWSPLVHHDPRATFKRSSYRAEPGMGRFLGAIRREDEHLEMAVQVFALTDAYVSAAAEQQDA